MSSASPCSSTTMARRRTARAPAAPARTSTTPAWSPTRSASRTTCSTTRAASGGGDRRFADDYLRGETPVPCIGCNQTVKFRDLLTTRATSAPRRWRPATMSPRGRCRRRPRRCTAPPTPSATRAISCSPPRGSSSISCASRSAACTKAETRELARRFGLPVADKPDSQDICFVPTGRYADLIERLRPGARRGAARSSISTAGCSAATPGSSTSPSASAGLWASPPREPLYVVRLDAATRRVVVGPRAALRTTPGALCATSTGSARGRSMT